MKNLIKDKTFTGKFQLGDLVREVGTDKVFIFTKNDSGCNFNSTFERVINGKK